MSRGPKSKAEITRNMSAIRSRDNRTEVALRQRLFALGMRYRLHPNTVFGRPDIVFSRERVAVFVDGDYWHARALREHGLQSLKRRLKDAANDYWINKFTRRVVRDDEVTATLRYFGWIVIRLWESDLRRDLEPSAAMIVAAVRDRRRSM